MDRRFLLQLGAFGVAALSTPGMAQILGVRGFTHGVASGEPSAHSVMLWTRYVSSGDTSRLRYQVSPTPDFVRIANEGEAMAESARDFCLKVMAEGLSPGSWYYYRFIDAEGRHSAIGRTRTLPAGDVDRFTLGIFSCSNMPFGYFNAYGHAAARGDLDLLVHLGDYIYEYARGIYPSAAAAVAGRVIEPAGELIHLADYRLRYAAYRADPDLQRLHQSFPMVMMWDDHEFANNAWPHGAQGHQPDSEGDWESRKAAAMQAYLEWLPVSAGTWAQYQIGSLATIFRPETRITGRSEEISLAAALRDQTDTTAALMRFRDDVWADPARTLLGSEQERWLFDGLRSSVRGGTRWQILAQQVVMGSLRYPGDLRDRLPASADEAQRMNVEQRVAAAAAGLPYAFDTWDAFPAARQRLLGAALNADANLVVLSGDSHNAWAFDLAVEGTPAGIDLGVQSVTSPGSEASWNWVPPEDVPAMLRASSPELRWSNNRDRGYMTLTLTPDRASAEWLFVDTIRERSMLIGGRHNAGVDRGQRMLRQFV